MLPINSITYIDEVNAFHKYDFLMKTSLVGGIIARGLFQDVKDIYIRKI